MDIKSAKAKYTAHSRGLPEDYAQRPIVTAEKVTGPFTNDLPVAIMTKPKTEQDKETGKWNRVLTKEGKPVFTRLAYIPILTESGVRLLVETTIRPTVGICNQVIGDRNPVLIRGTSFDDPNAWVFRYADDLIEGKLRFAKMPLKYGSKTFDVPVLDAYGDAHD